MSKSFTLQEIVRAVEGQLLGDGTLRVTRLAHPADIMSAGDLVVAMDAKWLSLVKDSSAKAAVIASNDKEDSTFIANRILVSRPRVALARLTALFTEPVEVKPGIHPSAVIEEGVKLGKNVAIRALAFIGANAAIGDNCVLHPQCYVGENAILGKDGVVNAGVRIGAGTHIGDHFLIHFNASIGADGFSFVTPQAGSVEAAKSTKGGEVTASNTSLVRIASLAPVMIGEDVEIGANTTIDRGTIVSSRIGNGTKIDNQVQIGHNVVIGDNCMICGRVGIAGSVTIGNRVVLGGGVGVADHITIGDDAIAMGMSGIGTNVAAKSIVGGYPALPREKAMEQMMNIGRLRQFFNKINSLTERLDRLENEGNSGSNRTGVKKG